MSVAETTASRLIPHANGVALDILFSKIKSGEPRLTVAPSSDAIRERWSTLPATLAVALITVIKDNELLDFIAARDKRKTVRQELLSNNYLHPITRIYFLQEGLRERDHEMVRSAIQGLPSAMMLELVVNDPTLRRHTRDRSIATALLECENADLAIHALTQLSSGDSNKYALAWEMFRENADKALELHNAAGITLQGHVGRSSPKGESASVETLQHLIAMSGDPLHFRTSVAEEHAYNLPKLIAIDPDLLNLLEARRIEINKETVETFIRHNKASTLIGLLKNYSRLDAEAVSALAEVVTTDTERVEIALAHPDHAFAASLVTDTSIFASHAAVAPVREFLAWISCIAPYIGTEKTFELLRMMGPRLELSGIAVELLANSFNLSNDQMLAALPDDLLTTISSTPALEDRHAVLDRAISISDATAVHMATLAMQLRGKELRLEIKAAAILLESREPERIAAWLSDASLEAVTAHMPTHALLITDVMRKSRKLRSQEQWSHLLLPYLEPVGGWKTVTEPHLISAGMKHLTLSVGDDTKLWNTVLSLYEEWSGTLDQLVDAARSL